MIKIYDKITAFAISRFVAWKEIETYKQDFNVTYMPLNYPIFSVLWLYARFSKKLTNEIKNETKQ